MSVARSKVDQPVRPAHHRDALPHARSPLPRQRRCGNIEVHIIRNHDVELSVPVVIYKRATRSPSLFRSRNASLVADILKDAAFVVKKSIVTVIGNVEIFPTIVVVVANANTLAPAGRFQPSRFRYIGKCTVVVVVIEVVRRRALTSRAFQRGSVDQKNIRPPVIVIVKNGDARSGGFDDVFFGFFPAKNVKGKQSSLLRLVGEIHNRSGLGLRARTCGKRRKEKQRRDRRSEVYPSRVYNTEGIRKGLQQAIVSRLFKFAGILATALLLTSSLARTTAPASPAAAVYQRGLEALRKGDLSSARAAFEKAVRLTPANADAQASLGWVLAQQGELAAATSHLKIAVKLRTIFANARITLASILAQQGKAPEAEQELRIAVKLEPKNAEAHRMLGRTLSQRSPDVMPFSSEPSVARATIVPEVPTEKSNPSAVIRASVFFKAFRTKSRHASTSEPNF